MHHYFIHQLRWLLSFILLFSIQVSANPCKNCGEESEPGKDGQMFCQTCDSGKLTYPALSRSSHTNKRLKRSAAKKSATMTTNDEIPAPSCLDPLPFRILLAKDENEDVLMARVQVTDKTMDAFERKDGKAYTKALAKLLAMIMDKIARNMKVDQLDMSFEDEHHGHKRKEQWDHRHWHKSLAYFIYQCEKQMKRRGEEEQTGMMQKLHQAALGAGAAETEKRPIHEKARALTRESVMKIEPPQWPDLSAMGMTLLLSTEFQNDQLMMDLSSVFQAIQEGNMIQLIITQNVAADEGNQAAAVIPTWLMLGAIIPDPAMNVDTESADMHLLIGTQQPLLVNQQNLMNVLVATIEIAGQNEQNADLSLHFFQSPQINIQVNEDPLSSIPNIENSINPNLPVSGFTTK